MRNLRPRAVLGAALAGLLVSLAPACGADEARFSDADKAEMGQIIRSYLLDNPEILIEAMQALQEKEAAQQKAKAAEALRTRKNDVFDDGYSFSIGAADAPVTVVEFFDYNCGFCRQALAKMMDFADANPDVRVVFKEFPVLGETSDLAARAAMAADEQGKYLEFHRALMGYEGRVSQDAIDSVAEDVGLDVAKLHADMDKDVYIERIAANHMLADALGLTGTPSFVVGDEVLSGWVEEELERMIAEARADG